MAVIERVLDGWRPRDADDPNLSSYFTYRINDAHRSLFASLHWKVRGRARRLRQEEVAREAAERLAAQAAAGWAQRGAWPPAPAPGGQTPLGPSGSATPWGHAPHQPSQVPQGAPAPGAGKGFGAAKPAGGDEPILTALETAYVP